MASAGRISPAAVPRNSPPALDRIEPVAGVPLIFELSSEGRRGIDLSPRAPASGAAPKSRRRTLPRGSPGLSRTERAAGAAAFPAPVAAQLRAGAAVLPARIVHDEVQPASSTTSWRRCRVGRAASRDARASGAGRARTDRADGSGARRDHRHGRGLASSRGRRAGRADRAADGPRVSSQARRSAAQGDHSRHRARHQSGQLHAGRLRGDRRAIEPARLPRSGRGSPPGERRRRCDDGHQSEHARNLRAGNPGDRRRAA